MNNGEVQHLRGDITGTEGKSYQSLKLQERMNHDGPGREFRNMEVVPYWRTDDVPAGEHDQSHIECRPRRDQPYSVEHWRVPLTPNIDRQRSEITDQHFLPMQSRVSEGVKEIMWPDRPTDEDTERYMWRVSVHWVNEDMGRCGELRWHLRDQHERQRPDAETRAEIYLPTTNRERDGHCSNSHRDLIEIQRHTVRTSRPNVRWTDVRCAWDKMTEMEVRWDSKRGTVNGPEGEEQVSEVTVINIRNRWDGPSRQTAVSKFWFMIKIKYPLPPTTRPIHDLLNSSTIQISTDGVYKVWSLSMASQPSWEGSSSGTGYKAAILTMLKITLLVLFSSLKWFIFLSVSE